MCSAGEKLYHQTLQHLTATVATGPKGLTQKTKRTVIIAQPRTVADQLTWEINLGKANINQTKSDKYIHIKLTTIF